MHLFSILLIPLVAILWLRKEVLRNPSGFRKALAFSMAFLLPWLFLRIISPELFTAKPEAGSIFLMYFLMHTLVPIFFCVIGPLAQVLRGKTLDSEQAAHLKTKLVLVFSALMLLDSLVFQLPGFYSRLFITPVLRLGLLVISYQAIIRFPQTEKSFKPLLLLLLVAYAALMWLPLVFEFFRITWLAWVSTVLNLGLFLAFRKFDVLENQSRNPLRASKHALRKQVLVPIRKLFPQAPQK